MLNFFLWTIGIMSVISMIINYICDIYYGHPILMRINQFLMYGVACVSAIAAYVYRENEIVFDIAILAFAISIIKSFSYYRIYLKLYKWAEEDEAEDEESYNEDGEV